MTPQHTIISSPVGKLGLSILDGKLMALKFMPASTPVTMPAAKAASGVVAQLAAYFNNPEHDFNLDLRLDGTPFQKAVWAALLEIPSGETVSYKTLAEKLKTSPRAVGNACRKNPVAIVVPCHRVVAKNGLGGYSGETSGKLMDVKKWLLGHEAA